MPSGIFWILQKVGGSYTDVAGRLAAIIAAQDDFDLQENSFSLRTGTLTLCLTGDSDGNRTTSQH